MAQDNFGVWSDPVSTTLTVYSTPAPSLDVFSLGQPLNTTTDGGRNQTAIEIFWEDILEFNVTLNDPANILDDSSFNFQFSGLLNKDENEFIPDKTIPGHQLLFTVGDDFFTASGNPPASQDQAYHYLVRFTATDILGNEYVVEQDFLIYPLATRSWTREFSIGGGTGLAEATLVWRGFQEEAAESEADWDMETKPVLVKIEEADSPTSPPPQGNLDQFFRVTVKGAKLQNGRTGYHSLSLKIPCDREAIGLLGNIDELEDDLRLYEYSREQASVEIPGSELSQHDDGYFLWGEWSFTGNGSSQEQIYYTVAPLVSSVHDGRALPDLVLTSIEFEPGPHYPDSTVNITIHFGNQGPLHAGPFEIRLMEGERTLCDLQVEGLEAGKSQSLVYAWDVDVDFYDIDERLNGKDVLLTVIIDPDRDIYEGEASSPTEQNNEQEKLLYVSPFPEEKPTPVDDSEDSDFPLFMVALGLLGILGFCLVLFLKMGQTGRTLSEERKAGPSGGREETLDRNDPEHVAEIPENDS